MTEVQLAPMSGPAVRLSAVTVERDRRPILDRLDWSVARGSCCAVIGPNGAGKSTLLAVITGYLWPRRGRVEVLGHELGRVELIELRRRIGIVGTSRLPDFHDDLTAHETVLAGRYGTVVIPPRLTPGAADHAAAAAELEAVGMRARAGKPFGTLSGGERMRVLLARAVVARPELLILDEPAAGLDMAGRDAFRGALERMIAERPELTTVVVTHHLEDLPAPVDRALLLRDGRALAEGPVGDVLTAANLTAAFGCDVDLFHENGRWWTRVRPAPWRL